MVRENVDIVFRESGIRVIKRNIDDLGNAAARATRGVFLLQRALFVLGGFGIIRSLAAQADALTNLENRLRLTTNSSRELQDVQTELFRISQRSRTDLDGVAQTYTRTALSAKALGRSQAEVLKFTESVTKAAVLSGASTREINASLIQLGQGIASNRLGGDELRSILEQLPLVADIIAKELGVTRGQLRELGSEGKLTGDVILDAFKNAAGEIDRLFAQTQPTIEQAFTIAKTNFLEFLDTFDDATDVSAKLANAIIFLSANIDILVRSAGLLAGLLALSFAGSALAAVASYAASLKQVSVQSTAVLQRLVRLRTAQVAKAQAILATNAARQVTLTQNLALIGQQKVLLQQAVLDAQYSVVNGRARNLLTGQFVALGTAKVNLSRLTQQLSIVEGVEATQAARLAAARAGQVGATNALTGATGRLTVATAAQGGALATFAARFPLLAGVVTTVTGALSGLWLLLAANPITAVIGLLAGLAIAITAFGDKIEFAGLGFVTLKDLAVASLQLVSEALAPFLGPIWNFIKQAVSTVGSAIGSAFSTAATVVAQVVTNIINTVTFLPRVVIAVVAGINAAWDSIPAAAGAAIDALTDMFATGMEFIANLGIKAVNKIIEAFNKLGGTKVGELLGIDAAELIPDATFDNLRTNFGGSGKSAGEAFSTAFTSSLESTRIENVVGSIGSQIVQRAQENAARSDRMLQDLAAQKAAEQAAANNVIPGNIGGGGGGGGGGANAADFGAELAEIQKRIDLERQYGIQKEANNAILGIEGKLKRELNASEEQQVLNSTRLLEIAKIQGEVLQGINGPQEKLILGQQALNELLAQGALTLEMYNTKLREMQIAAGNASGTLMGAFKASILSSIQSVSQLGTALGDWVVGAANNAADAIVEFANTGEFSVKQFFNQLFAQLLKLAAQQILLKLLGGFLGGGFLGGGGGLLGFAAGGSILPSGPGSTDSQVVAFKKRPDERVDILTPSQQLAQKIAGGGGASGQSSKVDVNQKIVNVLDPSIVGEYMSTAEGETLIINVINRSGILNR
jgi:tape measure domain-containing protein